MRPSPAQMAYINSLYNQLSVRYGLRKMPTTVQAASTLIQDLQEQVDELKNMVEDK